MMWMLSASRSRRCVSRSGLETGPGMGLGRSGPRPTGILTASWVSFDIRDLCLEQIAYRAHRADAATGVPFGSGNPNLENLLSRSSAPLVGSTMATLADLP